MVLIPTLLFHHLHYARSWRSTPSSIYTHPPHSNHSLHIRLGNHLVNNSLSLKYVNYFSKLAFLRSDFLVILYEKVQQSLQLKMASLGKILSSLDDGKVMQLTPTSMNLMSPMTFVNYYNSTLNSSSYPPTLNFLTSPSPPYLNILSLRWTHRMACRDLQRDSRNAAIWAMQMDVHYYFSTLARELASRDGDPLSQWKAGLWTRGWFFVTFSQDQRFLFEVWTVFLPPALRVLVLSWSCI